jgi:hypothetical protein
VATAHGNRVRKGGVGRLGVGLGVALAALVALAMLASWIWWLPEPSPAARSSGTNALWLQHSWVGDAHSPAEYSRLAGILLANQISDAYFHAGPIEADGGIPGERHAHASELLAALRGAAPHVRLQAYIGQLLTTGGGTLDLRRPAVRARILVAARTLLDLGFDGIHYDIEPMAPTDADFLDLLQRTRELTRARGGVLSVSIQKLEPVPGSEAWANALLAPVRHPSPLTTSEFLRRVADRSDQVAIMVYDTPLPSAPLIGGVYAWETAELLRLIGDRTTVFVGVPTYEEGPHLTGENLRTAIRGARRGIDQLRVRPRRPFGLAVFAEWTTSDREWRSWQRDWLAPGHG